ncbi:uncharacterized protein LOC135373224 [Ornithodoros turicata]|uniref:uncharacterized protein LOC135373224 n=1 Tax=Ornithodoros turicata TaxID=34597 RepID=UPI00313879C1
MDCENRSSGQQRPHTPSEEPSTSATTASNHSVELARNDHITDGSVVPEHGHGLPTQCLDELRAIILSQKVMLLELQEKVSEAKEDAEAQRIRLRQTEVAAADKFNEIKKEDSVLRSQLAYLQAEVDTLKERLEAKTEEFSYSALLSEPRKMRYYTGFSSPELLKGFFSFLQPQIEHLQYWQASPKTTSRDRRFVLSSEDQLLLTLMRLRLGLDGVDLTYRFGVSESTVSRIWITWVDFLYNRLRQVPTVLTPELCDKYRPQPFKDKSYSTVDGILDCTEIFIETPSSFRVQSDTYSNYKKHNTAKGLVMCSPNGLVTYVSDLSPGRLSDKDLTISSGVLETICASRSVMADRGFLIEEECRKRSIALNIPPFMRGKSQLSQEEEQETRKIASIRIHIERVIRRIKNYKILATVLPNTMTYQLNKIWHICARIINFTDRPLLDKSATPDAEN